MKRPKFTEAQIVSILKQADASVQVTDIYRQAGIGRADVLPKRKASTVAGKRPISSASMI